MQTKRTYHVQHWPNGQWNPERSWTKVEARSEKEAAEKVCGFSLAEARVLYELANRAPTTASVLAADLNLDAGYLSRILRRFGESGLLSKKPTPNDARQSLISITAKGRKAFAPLNKSSHDQVAAMLDMWVRRG